MLGRIGAGGDGLLLLGEAGIGKSILADAAERAAQSAGFTVGRGWCSSADMPAYWPWRWILRAVTGTRPFDEPPGPTGPDRDGVRWMFATVIDALDAATRTRPVVVILEDAHWADDGSWQLLAAVADALPAMPLGLVVTHRNEPGDPVRERVAALPTRIRRLEVTGLDRGAANALAEDVANGPLPADYLEALWHRTRGHPLFLREVVRLDRSRGDPVIATVPVGVRDVLARRVARLSQRCWWTTAAAALIGSGIDRPLLSATLAAAPADVDLHLAEAEAAHLVTNDRFVHALVREVLVDALPDAERRRLHRRIAELLERFGTAEPAQVARHWSATDGPDAAARAAALWLQSARNARAAMSGEQAVEFARRVLTLPAADRVVALNELGEAQRLTGAVDAARDSHRAAAGLAAEQARADDLARAALGFSGGIDGFEVQVGDGPGRELLDRAVEALGPADNPLLAVVRARRSLVGAATDTAADRSRDALEAVEMARRTGDRHAESATLAAYCDAIAGPDHQDQRERAARRMIALSHDSDPILGLLGRRLLVVALCERGGFAEVGTQIQAYRDAVADRHAPALAWLPDVWSGMLALLAGDAPSALRTAMEVDRLGRRAHSDNAALMAFTLRMHAHQSAGEPTGMIPEVRGLMSRLEPGVLATTYLAAPAWLVLSGGDDTDACAVLDRFLAERPEDSPKDAEWLEGHWALAEIALALGNRVAAQRLHDLLEHYPSMWAIDGMGGAAFGVIAHQLGRLGAFLGLPDAQGQLQTALAAYQSVGAPLLVARVERDLAGPGRGRTVDPDPSVGHLERSGRFWRLTWRGRTTTVPDGKGVRDLVHLLRRPGRPIAAVELVAAAGGPRTQEVGGDLGPVLDDAARRAYRARLVDPAEDLSSAEADHDLGRAERLRVEHEFLTTELTRATGLGGRARAARDPTERARKAVTMRVRAAIATVERADPALGRHLRHAVRTGRDCVYEPETEVIWRS